MEKCLSCRQQCQHPTHQRLLRSFPPKRQLEFVAMNILGYLPKLENGNTFIVVLSNRQSKLTRAIRTKTRIVTDVAPIFGEDWAVPYGVTNQLLADSGLRLVGKVLSAVCTGFEFRLLTTSAYHVQTIGQTEPYSKTTLG